MMRHKFLILFCLMSVLFCGIAAAKFGGEEDQNQTSAGQILAPVGAPMGNEEMGLTEGGLPIGPGMEVGMPTPGTEGGLPTVEAYPGSPIEAGQMAPWTPPAAMTIPQPAPSPIGEYVPSYETTMGAYYTTIAPPVVQQQALMVYNVQTSPPAAVYYNFQMYPWVQFAPIFPKAYPALWAITATGWQWYTICPFGAWVPEVMYVPGPSVIKLYEIYPNGLVKSYNYGWKGPGYYYLWFYADARGRHITVITANDIASNAVTIDVV